MKTGIFWSKRFYNPFTQKLGLEAQFEISDGKSDTKDDRATNTNIKEGSIDYNGKVVKPHVNCFDIPGGAAPQGFLS